ncbi:MAG TPA: endonuclease [Leptospiraceae bacterium]|jgi:endonuclease/exonuclease/phosphatase family metal-dependent hydrolase|nr:endonuclease [Spirochaetaceae bacterium]HBS07161.1 endonuclease [Leptospiraceae bacterium]|tara:strand:- start:59704 stop:60417 length:714 start_codon:yes stop_codon:yes gene_type:complete
MEISVLTYNIHKAIGNDRSYQPGRIVEILRESSADILCLQEVDFQVPRSHNDDLARKLAEALEMEYDLGLNVQLKKGAYGNATLSRFPIVHTENLNITWGIKKPRGCLMSRINTPAGEIAILNFHLGLAGFERMSQIRMILESSFLEMVRHEPVIMLGDTNDRVSKLNPLLADGGFQDTYRGNRMHSFPSYTPNPLIRIDKVFLNSRVELIEHRVLLNKRTRVASDHLPVLVRLKIK